jgi:hypothetical protein
LGHKAREMDAFEIGLFPAVWREVLLDASPRNDKVMGNLSIDRWRTRARPSPRSYPREMTRTPPVPV